MPNRRSDIRFLAACVSSIFFCLCCACPGQALDRLEGHQGGTEFDLRMYLMISGYYDSMEGDPVVNPGNILGQETTGLLSEVNAQGKIAYRDDYLIAMDASYQYSPGPGAQKDTDTHFNTNEMYVDLFLNQWAYLRAGKRRESWSVGNVFYPLDIINPRRNPLDPSKSREGVYLTAIEIPLGASSMTLAYYPGVEYGPDDLDGIPGRMDFRDGGLGIRSYFLVRDTDISLVYYRADRTPSLMKDYFGLTLNRFFGYLGAYVEAMGHQGRDIEMVSQDTLGEYYFPDDIERAEQGRVDQDMYVDVAVGTDYTFSDNTRIGVEYLHNSEGYSDEEFDQLCGFFIHDSECYLRSYDTGCKNKLLKGAGILQGRIRSNYLALSFDRPNTLDDFFPRLNVVISLDDGSFAIGGLVNYLIRDDTTLKLVFSRLVGDARTEYGLRPAEGRVTLEAKYYW